MRNLLQKIILVLLLVHSYSSYAWLATGHALTAHIASKLLTDKTTDQVNEFLKIPIDFPKIQDGKDIAPASVVELSSTLSNMQSASIWADSIKSYRWTDQNLQNTLSSMHFLDVQLDISNVDVGSCGNLHKGDLEKLSSTGNNIVRGIKMAIKTLSSNDITITKPYKATALRFLLHWMGDLHQPLHICSPILESTKTHIPTNGGNLVFFQDPHSIYFERVVGKETDTNLDTVFCNQMHLSFDAMLGLVNQLPEAINNSTYSPTGYTLWKENMDIYIKYLDKILRDIPEEIDNIKPNIITWANNTRKAGCRAMVNKEIVHLYLNQDDNTIYVVLKNRDTFLRDNRAVFMSLINNGGQRLGKLLNAIFDSHMAEQGYISLIRDINNDTSIPMLNLDSTILQ